MAAFQHREPDRIRIDFSGHRSSGIAAIAYARLRNHLGLPQKPLRVYDPVQQIAMANVPPENVVAMFEAEREQVDR